MIKSIYYNEINIQAACRPQRGRARLEEVRLVASVRPRQARARERLAKEGHFLHKSAGEVQRSVEGAKVVLNQIQPQERHRGASAREAHQKQRPAFAERDLLEQKGGKSFAAIKH